MAVVITPDIVWRQFIERQLERIIVKLEGIEKHLGVLTGSSK